MGPKLMALLTALSEENGWSRSQQASCHQKWQESMQLQCPPNTGRVGEPGPKAVLLQWPSPLITYLQRIRLASAHHLTQFYGLTQSWHRIRAPQNLYRLDHLCQMCPQAQAGQNERNSQEGATGNWQIHIGCGDRCDSAPAGCCYAHTQAQCCWPSAL